MQLAVTVITPAAFAGIGEPVNDHSDRWLLEFKRAGRCDGDGRSSGRC